MQVIQAALQASKYSQPMQLSRSELQRSPRDFKIRTLEGFALAGLGRDNDALKAYDIAPLFPLNLEKTTLLPHGMQFTATP